MHVIYTAFGHSSNCLVHVFNLRLQFACHSDIVTHLGFCARPAYKNSFV